MLSRRWVVHATSFSTGCDDGIDRCTSPTPIHRDLQRLELESMILKNKSAIKPHISHKVMFTTLGASWQCACSVRVLNYLSTVRAVIYWNQAYLGKWGQRCRETDGIRLAFILKR